MKFKGRRITAAPVINLPVVFGKTPEMPIMVKSNNETIHQNSISPKRDYSQSRPKCRRRVNKPIKNKNI